jgi:hypothetical protein
MRKESPTRAKSYILTKRFFFPPKTSRPALGLPSPIFDTHRGCSSQRVEWPGVESDQLLNLRMRGAVPLLPLMPSLRPKGQLCLYSYMPKLEPTQLCVKWNVLHAFPPQWYTCISQYCLSCVRWLLVLDTRCQHVKNFFIKSHNQFSKLYFISATEVDECGPQLDLLLNHPMLVLENFAALFLRIYVFCDMIWI